MSRHNLQPILSKYRFTSNFTYCKQWYAHSTRSVQIGGFVFRSSRNSDACIAYFLFYQTRRGINCSYVRIMPVYVYTVGAHRVKRVYLLVSRDMCCTFNVSSLALVNIPLT